MTKAELIRDVLASLLPPEGLVLELAAGTGDHSFVFAERFGHLIWEPTDRDPDAVTSIAAHRSSSTSPDLERTARHRTRDVRARAA